jgi:hypothetical protein
MDASKVTKIDYSIYVDFGKNNLDKGDAYRLMKMGLENSVGGLIESYEDDGFFVWHSLSKNAIESAKKALVATFGRLVIDVAESHHYGPCYNEDTLIEDGITIEEVTTMNTNDKLGALRTFLVEDGSFSSEELAGLTCTDEEQGIFEVGDFEYSEYRVLTESEANDAVREYITDSIWAFNTEFILRHASFYGSLSSWEAEQTEKALREMQGNMCEGCNALLLALIEDIDAFIEDAVDCDGRGHFLATYDGEENEEGDFLIYRIN